MENTILHKFKRSLTGHSGYAKPITLEVLIAEQGEIPYDQFSKAELEIIGRKFGNVELDKRKTKAKLIEELKEVIDG
tara:strand:- start:48 stop:278 length:231 start_codon:yes stop_codon:yes gene_type:complete